MAELKENMPSLWAKQLPFPGRDSHKYTRGHAVIFGGTVMTGAARLAAEACMRIGAGLCTIVAPVLAGIVYQQGAPHILYEPLGNWGDHLQDQRRNAILVGPGAGQDNPDYLRAVVRDAARKAAVIDADGLNVFTGRAGELAGFLHQNCVLTPHEGEFGRLFGNLTGSRTEKAVAAAHMSGAMVVLKGAETVIASPGGRLAVNAHASPYLATAGAGDVLAGMILGLLAQGMPAFEAACAAVWIHGDASLRFGPGLVAPDIIAQIPSVMRELT